MSADLHRERATGLGGSDIAGVYGLAPACSRRLAYDKAGVPADYPQEISAAMERGSLLEPIVRMVYEQKTGFHVKPSGFARIPECPWAIVHADGIIHTPNRTPGLFESKVRGPGMVRKIKKEGLPFSDILQVQHGMWVLGLEWAGFATLCVEPWQLIEFEINRDEEIIGQIGIDGQQFWESVNIGWFPDRLEPEDPRCGDCPWRRTCQQEALVIRGQKAGEGLIKWERDDGIAEQIAAYREALALENEVLELKAERRKDLEEALAGREHVICQSIPVRYTEYSGWRWDTKALNSTYKAARPETKAVLERFRKPSFGKRLTIGGRDPDAMGRVRSEDQEYP